MGWQTNKEKKEKENKNGCRSCKWHKQANLDQWKTLYGRRWGTCLPVTEVLMETELWNSYSVTASQNQVKTSQAPTKNVKKLKQPREKKTRKCTCKVRRYMYTGRGSRNSQVFCQVFVFFNILFQHTNSRRRKQSLDVSYGQHYPKYRGWFKIIYWLSVV